MKQVKHIQKIAFAILLVFAAQFVFAAFTTTGKKNNKQTESKYTLKNLSSFTNKGLSLAINSANNDKIKMIKNRMRQRTPNLFCLKR